MVEDFTPSGKPGDSVPSKPQSAKPGGFADEGDGVFMDGRIEKARRWKQGEEIGAKTLLS